MSFTNILLFEMQLLFCFDKCLGTYAIFQMYHFKITFIPLQVLSRYHCGSYFLLYLLQCRLTCPITKWYISGLHLGSGSRGGKIRFYEGEGGDGT